MSYKYAVTGDEEARQEAVNSFKAMVWMDKITPIDGFIARSIWSSVADKDEMGRHGSGGLPAKWYPTPDSLWYWKGDTSSDEVIAHFYAVSIFHDLVAEGEEKEMAKEHLARITSYIMDNGWVYIDMDGKTTRWGRWNPEYVNKFSIHTGDRRLNSTLIIAFLQTAYHFTGDEKYKEKAYELINEYGYDENANRPASVIGYVEGQDLSDTWNHSDDRMYFLTISAFVNYSFTEEQKQKHFEELSKKNKNKDSSIILPKNIDELISSPLVKIIFDKNLKQPKYGNWHNSIIFALQAVIYHSGLQKSYEILELSREINNHWGSSCDLSTCSNTKDLYYPINVAINFCEKNEYIEYVKELKKVYYKKKDL